MSDDIEDWKDAIARDDRREAMRGQPEADALSDEEKRQKWQHCIDRTISRAMQSGERFTVASVIDGAGLIECGETLGYATHVLAAIGGPPERNAGSTVGDSIPIEERCECLTRVLFSTADDLDDEAKDRAVNAQRSLRVIRLLYERMQLRTLLGQETDRFLSENE